jgi:hypothetical protein
MGHSFISYQGQGAERHLSGFLMYETLKDAMHSRGIAFFGHLDMVKFKFEFWLYLDS